MIITNTAASATTPPICSATSMAIGEVTDLGARVIRIISSAPNAQASAIPNAVANTPATSRVITIGPNNSRMRRRFRYSGTARATVAGPRSSVSHWALMRYSA